MTIGPGGRREPLLTRLPSQIMDVWDHQLSKCYLTTGYSETQNQNSALSRYCSQVWLLHTRFCQTKRPLLNGSHSQEKCSLKLVEKPRVPLREKVELRSD